LIAVVNPGYHPDEVSGVPLRPDPVPRLCGL